MVLHSSYSVPELESWVTPLPTPNSASAVSRSTVTVRMATLNWASGPGDMYPMLPVYTPRGESSSSEMISMVRTFGAPVTEPHGNAALRTSETPTPLRRRDRTVEVI